MERSLLLINSIQAPTMHLLLRKEFAQLARIPQSRFESMCAMGSSVPLMEIGNPQIVYKVNKPSLSIYLLRCLIIRPALIKHIPDWISEKIADSEAVAQVIHWMRTQPGEIMTDSLINHFRGTHLEKMLDDEYSLVAQLNDAFDVMAEFNGVIERLNAQLPS